MYIAAGSSLPVLVGDTQAEMDAMLLKPLAVWSAGVARSRRFIVEGERGIASATMIGPGD